MPHYKLIFLVSVCVWLNGCGGQGNSTGSSGTEPTPAASATPAPDVSAMVKRLVTQGGCRDFSAEIRMNSKDRAGKRNQIEFKVQRKYSADRTSTFITVLSPREEMDKAFLAVEQPDQMTQAFFYLPGLKKLTRLNSGKQLGFRDTEVSVQELLGMELGQYTYGHGERIEDRGQPRIMVELREKPDLGLAFPRIVGFFREEDQQPVRFELYDLRNELLKIVRVEAVRTIQNYQTLTRLVIEDLQRKLELDLETRQVEYDRGLSDRIFTEDHLKNFVNLASHTLDQNR